MASLRIHIKNRGQPALLGFYPQSRLDIKTTVEPPVATSFPKYQKFPSQITILRTSRKRPPLVSNRDHF